MTVVSPPSEKHGSITKIVRLVLESDSTNVKDVREMITEEIDQFKNISLEAKQTIMKSLQIVTGMKAAFKHDTSAIDNPSRRYAISQADSAAKTMDNIAKEGVGYLKKTLNIVQDVYQRIKSASPILETVGSLFNLAMQLFFMPLGNKLATVMIPAVLQLIDNVMAMWDAFEGKSLSDIFGMALEKGMHIFGEYFSKLGNILQETTNPTLHSIGSLIKTVGNLIQSGEIVALAKTGVSILQIIIERFKEIISAIVAFRVASMTGRIQTTIAIYKAAAAICAAEADKTGIAGFSLATSLMVDAVAGGVGFALTEGSLTAAGYAGGGYIPHKAGGTLIRAGEHEGEYIVPKSLMNGNNPLKGGNTYDIHIEGLTWEQAQNWVSDLVDNKMNESRLRTGY